MSLGYNAAMVAPAHTLYFSELRDEGWCLEILTSSEGLVSVGFETNWSKRRRWLERHFPQVEHRPAESRNEPFHRQLREYLAGRRRVFDLPLDLRGSPFQLSVWEQVAAIPYGCTASYGDIAHLLGNPGASRAVGAANGANPVPLIVPCHRVVGSDGSLTGFGGGLPIKQRLLALEGLVFHPEVQMRLFS